MTGNAAIYFHDESFRVDLPNVMGRQAAGHGFLKGFLAHAAIGELAVHVDGRAQRLAFARQAAALGGRNAGLAVRWSGPQDPRPLAEVGALHLPGPSLAGQAWHRRRHGAARWSLTGVTHTLSTHHAMDQIGALLTGPVEPWDALICTSAGARRTVERLLDGYAAYLRQRLGAARRARPQLPVIPLGVDCAALDPGPRAAGAARRRCRERLGIAPGDLVVLYVGRLSWHAKANPLPMYLGLERAAAALAAAGQGPLHLIEAGQHTTEWIRDGLAEARRALMPAVRHHHVDGRDDAAMAEVRHAADLFCSLPDNIQETFGLTPVEAMAAGLPVVASDWDGYRDTLVHGETALLVPTTLPAAGAGLPLARRYEDGVDSYDHYCTRASLAAAVDVPAAAEALTALLRQPERRAAMGEAGRRRAAALYDWRVVIGRYQELWAELAAIRPAGGTPASSPSPGGTPAASPSPGGSPASSPSIGGTPAASPSPGIPPASSSAGVPPAGIGPANPLRDDPFRLFGHYASRRLGGASRLRAAASPPAALALVASLRIGRVEGRAQQPSAPAEALLGRLRAAGPAGLALAELLRALPEAERAGAALGLGWLLKAGLAEIVAD
jgi:glycosyltransferase involved in cell wall biosynthesis